MAFAASNYVASIMPQRPRSGKPREASPVGVFPLSGMTVRTFSSSVASSFETRLAPLLRMRSLDPHGDERGNAGRLEPRRHRPNGIRHRALVLRHTENPFLGTSLSSHLLTPR